MPDPEPVYGHPDKNSGMQEDGQKLGSLMTGAEYKFRKRIFSSRKTSIQVMPKEIRRIGLGVISFSVLMLIAAIVLNLVEYYMNR